MSACDGTGRAIGCPGCAACEQEMATLDAAKADALDALAHLAFRSPRIRTIDADPWGDPREQERPAS